jgi:hypothetical protein
MPLTFVVSTGRSGSTMLSNILHMHPDVLSVSEFLAILMETTSTRDIPTYDMDGKELWALVATPSPRRDALISEGLWRTELQYPFATGRYNTTDGVPVICHNVLSSLSSDPDTLFDKLAEQVVTWPKRTAAAQYRALFKALANLMGGRRVIVERSGGSLPALPTLQQQFPDARFVFLHRDGADTALSMSSYFAVRMMCIAGEAAMSATTPLPPNPTIEQIAAAAPPEFDGLLVPPLDGERIKKYQVSLTFCGELWSKVILEAVDVLKRMPRNRWMSMKYERLLESPRTELPRMAEFIGVPVDQQWLDIACGSVDPSRSGKASAQVDPGLLASLKARCAPGERAIADLKTAAGLIA